MTVGEQATREGTRQKGRRELKKIGAMACKTNYFPHFMGHLTATRSRKVCEGRRKSSAYKKKLPSSLLSPLLFPTAP